MKYCSPENYNARSLTLIDTEKADVYSLGVLIIDLMGIENIINIVGNKSRPREVDPSKDFNKVEAFIKGSLLKFKKAPAFSI